MAQIYHGFTHVGPNTPSPSTPSVPNTLVSDPVVLPPDPEDTTDTRQITPPRTRRARGRPPKPSWPHSSRSVNKSTSPQCRPDGRPDGVNKVLPDAQTFDDEETTVLVEMEWLGKEKDGLEQEYNAKISQLEEVEKREMEQFEQRVNCERQNLRKRHRAEREGKTAQYDQQRTRNESKQKEAQERAKEISERRRTYLLNQFHSKQSSVQP
ncbi:hypothetical protein, variant 3 [Cladophialophora immunda]|uniref:Uncharacterized protein n=1 Tax=Cladophialophora immunda TaxID=569365 RepID=A0A0D1Z349_9EURO|nr:hypothetical protein, variant 2 [Cladophialophora immunda]XP_016242242.1 hypothetical protein, variant 3 [Cladophialophora immunda]KIW22025.1 hypothetical protein, variant 2 [Cladophialophora immunda]KIW22026.1 hypothetical protein, variant 3 [Cladophialophora immunda]